MHNMEYSGTLIIWTFLATDVWMHVRIIEIVWIIERPDNWDPDNRGSTVMHICKKVLLEQSVAAATLTCKGKYRLTFFS